MCGIYGVILPDPAQALAPQVLEDMGSALRYRGPDAEGLWSAPGVWLGHRRLKIIDLEGGVQPMADPQGQVVLSYNGEVYNFLELRRELREAGAVLRTRSDTEVILQGYLHWGLGVLDRIVGMYAFAIWDGRSRTLLLARDRLGVKPLYWAELPGGGLVFASELKAILASGLVARRVDFQAAARYCAFGYVMGEESMVEGVRRLPAAATLTWQNGRVLGIKPYWDMARLWREARQSPLHGREIQEAFQAGLEQATVQRMVSDVPLGAFLSGGLDSSAVAALMRRHSQEVRTYSIGFRYASFDESGYARQTAAALGCRHFDQIVDCRDPALLLEIVSRLDEPFADTSILPTYALCRMARRQVTVALSGDGADELLAGYVTHLANRYYGLYRRLPAPLAGALRALAGLWPDSRRKVNLVFKAKQFLGAHPRSPAEAHGWWRTICPPEALRRLLPGAGEGLPDIYAPFRQAYARAQGLAELDRFLYIDYQTWLVDDILVKADRASMNHGLEIRSPFLDTRLVELMMRAPPACKLSGRTTKVLLRQCARAWLPAAVLKRRKAGFNAPVAQWLCEAWRELAEEAFGHVLPVHMPGLDGAWLRGRWSEHLSGRRDHGYGLFALLVLALWLRENRLTVHA